LTRLTPVTIRNDSTDNSEWIWTSPTCYSICVQEPKVQVVTHLDDNSMYRTNSPQCHCTWYYSTSSAECTRSKTLLIVRTGVLLYYSSATVRAADVLCLTFHKIMGWHSVVFPFSVNASQGHCSSQQQRGELSPAPPMVWRTSCPINSGTIPGTAGIRLTHHTKIMRE
jgi:hypothetical protein